MPIAPIMIYGDDVSHVVTEEGIAYLYKATRHGLPIPGAYFKNKESQRPATVAVSKPGKVVGEQKQKMSKAGKKRMNRVR